jgi:hypothetical protein
VAGVLCAFACAPSGALPRSSSVRRAADVSGLQASIETQPVCIGSTVVTAGTMADTLYYRAVSLPDGSIAVGYFVFFSEERPWGNNWLTWTVLPAVGVDMLYSRLLLVAPGVQRALYGKGDVEGFRIVYRREPNGELRVDSAVADDRNERFVALDRDHLLALDAKRPTLYTDIWSHQLGAQGVRSKEDLATLHCYQGDRIQPLSDDIARDFRVEHRADPAHVELLGGTTIHEG